MANRFTAPNTKQKRRLRREIIERDGHTNCHWCRRPTTLYTQSAPIPWDGLTIDRIVAGYDGGLYVLENCVIACNRCNWDRGRPVAERATEDTMARLAIQKMMKETT